MSPSRYRTPRRTYLIPLFGAALLTWGRSLATEYALASISPDDLKGWIVVAAWFLIGIGVGALMHDLKSQDSWIAHDIRVWRRVFDLEMAFFPHDSTPDIEWNHLRVRIRFIRPCKANLRAKIHYIAGTPRAQTFVLDEASSSASMRERDELVDMTLATFPLKAYDGNALGYSAWGATLRRSGQVQGMISLSEGTESVIEVSARTWRGVQTERILLAWPATKGEGFGKVTIIDGHLISINPLEN